MIQWARFASKAAKLGKKAKSKASSLKAKKTKFYKDVDMYKGNIAKQFAADARKEGRALRKNVFTGKNAYNTFMNYPITTGVGLGITARAVLPKKEKKNKKKV